MMIMNYKIETYEADEIVDLLFDLNKKGLMVVLVTCEKKYVERADRVASGSI